MGVGKKKGQGVSTALIIIYISSLGAYQYLTVIPASGCCEHDRLGEINIKQSKRDEGRQRSRISSPRKYYRKRIMAKIAKYRESAVRESDHTMLCQWPM